MADAGYDPEDAVKLWTRAQSDPAFDSIPFLSTHPGAGDRLAQLRELSTQAKVRYEQNKLGINAAVDSVQKPVEFTGAPPADKPKPTGGASGKCVTAWTVKDDAAIVYDEPNTDSKKRGELSRGATVCAVSNRKGWIRIETPDTGYINSANLILE
jgi:hypothetical protein